MKCNCVSEPFVDRCCSVMYVRYRPRTCYGYIMKIVLLRHGQPDFEQKWVAPGNGSKYYLDRYAASNVTTEPPAELRKIHLPDKKYVSSTLARSVDSARLLGYSNCVSHKLFNESDLPYPNRLLVPLPWSVFLAIYRFLWLVGFKQNCPGRSADEDRAYEASHILADLASATGRFSVSTRQCCTRWTRYIQPIVVFRVKENRLVNRFEKRLWLLVINRSEQRRC